jgi:hypothetical protein
MPGNLRAEFEAGLEGEEARELDSSKSSIVIDEINIPP